MRPLLLVALLALTLLAGCKKCLEYEPRPATCGGGCAVWIWFQNADGTSWPACVTWEKTYPCTENVCVRREP